MPVISRWRESGDACAGSRHGHDTFRRSWCRKTTLVRRVLRGLHISGPVKSLTYTLVEPYAVSSLYLYHFDFYRLSEPEECEAAGSREYFRNDAICQIEWPERAGALLPPVDLQIVLEVAEDGRRCTVMVENERADACLAALASFGPVKR
jgi:tRNA threonylcarbamoyladenosine biosynthesis protein TsaE